VSIALQAPTGSNAQGWHFVVVTDPAKRKALADVYRRAFDVYRGLPIAAGNIVTGRPSGTGPSSGSWAPRSTSPAHLHEVPVHVVPCTEGRVDGEPLLRSASVLGSIIPATWSFMLACRARGLGTSWTTLHLMFEEEAAEILGIPHASVSQVALVPVAYTQGTDFKVAPREPVDSVLHLDGW
jgi:nitroreductase